jgi:hypothetical protein
VLLELDSRMAIEVGHHNCFFSTHLAQTLVCHSWKVADSTEDRLWNGKKDFVKLIKSESSVFMNTSIVPVFHILNDDRWASRSCFIVHICPSPIKQTTRLMHIPLVHDTFPVLFSELEIDFGREDVFRVQKSNHLMHLTIGWISYWQWPVHSMGTWQINWPLVSDLCGRVHRWVLL